MYGGSARGSIPRPLTINWRIFMSEKEMFEKSFLRPKNFFRLSGSEQYKIDKELGILDWVGDGLSKEEIERFEKHYS